LETNPEPLACSSTLMPAHQKTCQKDSDKLGLCMSISCDSRHRCHV